MRKLNDNQINDLIQRYKDGASTYELSSYYGLHQSSVWSLLSRRGLTRTLQKALRILSGDEEERVISLYSDGLGTKEISKKFGVSLAPINRIIHSAGIMRGKSSYRKRLLDETVFDIVTDESAYWIGFIAADGSVFKDEFLRICIKESDEGHLKKFNEFVKSDIPIYKEISGFGASIRSIKVSSKKLVKKLEGYGIVPRKSKTLVIRGLEYNKHFWRGVIDGDGCISINKDSNNPYISLCGSQGLMHQFKDFVISHVVKTDANVRKNKSIYTFGQSGLNAFYIISLLYTGSLTSLERKQVLANKIIQDGLFFYNKKGGEQWFSSKLTINDVEDIRNLKRQLTTGELSSKFNVDYSTIRRIINYETWV